MVPRLLVCILLPVAGAVQHAAKKAQLSLEASARHGPGEYTCASEVLLADTCNCTGLVKYGQGGSWTLWKNVSSVGSIECSSETFGGDPAPGVAKYCVCQPEEYICASEHGSAMSNCTMPECSLGQTCSCQGMVSFGYGDRWSASRTATGSVQCNSDVFGDPFPGQGKLCKCRLAPDVFQSALGAASEPGHGRPAVANQYAPVGKIMLSTLGVTLVYIVVYTALAAVRSAGQLRGEYASVVSERILASGTSVVYLAPMLCTLFLALTKRADTLTYGMPYTYGFPPTYLSIATNVCAAAFCLQVICHLRAEWVVAHQAAHLAEIQDRPDQHASTAATTAATAIRLGKWTFCTNAAITVMYGALIVIIFGISFMKEPVTLTDTRGQVPLAPGTVCTLILAVAYFAVYWVFHCLKTRDLGRTLSMGNYGGGGATYTSFGAEVMELATATMSFAPMLSALFLGAQVSVDWSDVEPSGALEACMYMCTVSVLLQVVLVLLTPFVSDAEMEVTGSRGEVNLYARNPRVFVVIGLVRWACMTALYAGVIVLSVKLCRARPAPPLTHLLAQLSIIYFASYLVHWIATTARCIVGEGFLKIIRIMNVAKDTVAFCPMLAVLALESFVRARRLTNKDGKPGVPQGFVQDYLYVAVLALSAQLLMTLLSGIVARTQVSSGSVGKRRDLLPVFLAIFYLATLMLYLSVFMVALGLFTITPETATGHQARWLM